MGLKPAPGSSSIFMCLSCNRGASSTIEPGHWCSFGTCISFPSPSPQPQASPECGVFLFKWRIVKAQPKIKNETGAACGVPRLFFFCFVLVFVSFWGNIFSRIYSIQASRYLQHVILSASYFCRPKTWRCNWVCSWRSLLVMIGHRVLEVTCFGVVQLASLKQTYLFLPSWSAVLRR